jgi:hypothetical protein
MGRKNRRGRDGRVVTGRAGERWTAQLELDELHGGRFSRLRIDVQGKFPSEPAAIQAAQAVLTEWRMGGVTLRDLLLRELAAAYRHLRERHPSMEPVAVPTTSGAWNRAITLWEETGWLDATEAARYREHAARAFDSTVVTVKRHGLLEAGSDAGS